MLTAGRAAARLLLIVESKKKSHTIQTRTTNTLAGKCLSVRSG